MKETDMSKSPTEIEKEDRERLARKKTINYFAGAALAYLVNVREPENNAVKQAFNLAEAMYVESEKRYGKD